MHEVTRRLRTVDCRRRAGCDRPADAAAARGRARLGVHVVAAYVALTKPRIIELLLITTVPVMFLAAAAACRRCGVVATMVGGTLSAGSANALNCYVDRDIDEKMRRTRRRPLPRHQVPARALIFGIVLGVAATLWLGLHVNWLSAGAGARGQPVLRRSSTR